MEFCMRCWIQIRKRRITYPAGGNKTDFLTGYGLAGDGGRLSDMLVVTTTVGVIHGVHSNTTSTGPATYEVSIGVRVNWAQRTYL